MKDKKVKKISSQVMELQQLIAGPLIATVEADSLSTQQYLDYLMRIAFESYDPVTGKTGKIRTLTFSFTEQDINGAQKKSVNIPLLTLVPLPLLQIQEADFDFDIKILDAFCENMEEKFSVKQGIGVKEPQETVGFKMRASLAPQQSSIGQGGELQQSLAANMKVKVKMRQADMPAGLSNLLHLTANNLQIEDEGTVDETEGGTDDGQE